MKSSRHRRRAWWLVVLGALIGTAAISAFVFRPDRALRVGTAVVSEALCGGVFVSKLDPDRVFAEDVVPNRGLQLLRRHLHYTIDRGTQTVSATWLGHFRSIEQQNWGQSGLSLACARLKCHFDPPRTGSGSLLQRPLRVDLGPSSLPGRRRATWAGTGQKSGRPTPYRGGNSKRRTRSL
ncbi:MAG TPA: hypothetical protein VHO91_15255 [Rhodopila sp.]|nr:hypothetical protein [Rhodopila sp.]